MAPARGRSVPVDGRADAGVLRTAALLRPGAARRLGQIELTVVSWNIRAGIGPGEFPVAWWRHVDEHRIQRVAGLVNRLDADLVALQEVALASVDGRVLDQAAELGRLTNMEHRYGAVRHFALRGPDDDTAVGAGLWGNAILSRHAIVAAATHALPVPVVEDPDDAQDTEPRCALQAEVALAAGRPSFISTHFAWHGQRVQRLHAERLAEVVDGLAGPVVVAGDLNATIDSAQLAPLAGLNDAFAAVGVAAGDARRGSFERIAIDHLFVRGLDVLDCRVVAEAGDTSDHLPVVARVRLSDEPGSS